MGGIKTYPLLVRLVDGIQSILDGDTLEVAGGDFQAQGEVQVNSLNRGFRQVKLQDAWVVHSRRALVDFPGDRIVKRSNSETHPIEWM